MKKFKELLVLLILSNVLASCGGDGDSNGGGTPTSIKTYQLFPDGYFSTGFREDYSITGTDEFGAVFAQGTRFELAQQTKTFNNQQVIPILVQNDWTDVNSGADATTSVLSNYATGNELRLIGEENLLDGITSIGSNPSTIPSTAKVGDSGSFGSYADNIGNTTEITWRLESDAGDFAKIIIDSIIKSSDGTALIVGNTAYIIDESGNRQSMTIFVDFRFLGSIKLNWAGVKL